MTATYLRVKNWDKFQHYHNRPNAPYWIKMYPDLLMDFDFLKLTEAERYRLMAIWLLASKLRNRIPYDAKYVGKVIGTSRVNLDKLVELGFLEQFVDDTEGLDAGLDVGLDAGRTQNRTEEIEKEKRSEGSAGKHDVDNFEYDPVVQLLISIGNHSDDHTERTIRKIVNGNRLSEGDVAFARECCEGPGVENRARVAVDALKRRAQTRKAAA